MTEHPLNAQEYDQDEYEGPVLSYILCTAPRCGGTLFGSLLYGSGIMGVPHEYFHPEEAIPGLATRWQLPPNADDKMYIEAIQKNRSTPNGAFGLKAHYSQMAPMIEKHAFKSFLRTVKCFVHITRKDLIAQAVSYAIAHQSREWSSLHTIEAKPSYDGNLISNALNDIMSQTLQWQRFFSVNGISPIQIIYEDFLENPNLTCQEICHAMNVTTHHDFSITKSPLKKQSTNLNIEWITRYKLENKAF